MFPATHSPAAAPLSAALLLALLAPVSAGEIQKAPNGDDLGFPSSWTGGLVPGVDDIVVWRSDVPAVNGVDFFGPLLSANATTWGGLRVVANTGDQAIDNFAGGGATATLTLGRFGLDLAQATSGTSFKFDRPTVALEAYRRQQWTVPDGVSVILESALVRGGVNKGVNSGSSVHFNLGGSGSVSLKSGMSTEQFPVNRELVLIPGATIGSGTTADFAAINADTVNKLVVPLFSLPQINVLTGQATGTLTLSNNTVTNPTYSATAPASPAIGGTGPMINVVNQYQTTSTGEATTTPIGGFTTSNSASPQGVRFSVPSLHAGGNWTMTVASGTTTMPHGFMVTSGVGTSDVVVAGANATTTLRIGNSPWLMHLHQDNTQGDLFLNVANITATNTGASVLKTGAGLTVVTSTFQVGPTATNRVAGGLTVLEGTLQIGNNTATGNLPLGTITNRSALVFNRTGTLVVPNVLTGGGSITVAGTGEVQLSGVNTFTGPLNLQAGTLSVQNAGALGTSGALAFSGGKLALATGVTADLSSRGVSFASGAGTLDVGSNNLVFAQPIGGGGAGSFVKAGAGKLTLLAANDYSGATTISAGTLEVANPSGSATGSGSVLIGGSGTLGGTGAVSGAVATVPGSKIAPGSSGVGTLTVGSLSLASGSLLDVEIAPGSGNDKVVVTSAGGLTLNGGSLSVHPAGGTGGFSTLGSYPIFEYNGALQGAGVSALTVLNPEPGYDYTFSANGNAVSLIVALGSTLSAWNPNGSGSWGSGANWSAGVPSGDYTAQFTTQLAAPATVTLDGNRSVNGVSFASAEAYTLAAGTPSNSVLTLDNGTKLASMNVTQGSHTISAPIALASKLAVATAGSTALTLAGVVSGSQGLVKTGPGRLALTAANTFTGSIEATGGVLAFALPTSLGTGSAITLNGGAIEYGLGNTLDLSTRAFTVGLNGATIDTNGNDVIFTQAIGGAGTGRLTKSGAGSLTLSAPSTFTGGVRVLGGELSVSNIDQLGAGAIELNGGILDFSTTATIPAGQTVTLGASGGTIASATGATVTLASVVQEQSGSSVALTLAGPGAFSLTAVNTFTGGLAINAASATVNSTVALGTGPLTLTDADLTLPVSSTLSLPLVVNGASTLRGSGVLLLGSITGSGTLSVVPTANSTTVDLGASNSAFAGRYDLTTGAFTGTSVRLYASTGAIGGSDAATFTIGSGVTLGRRTGLATIRLGALEGAGSISAGFVVTGLVDLQIGRKNLDTTFSGVIGNGTSGSFAKVTKVGTGTLTLSGANTYTSSTLVNEGALLVDGALSGTDLVTVNTNGTLGGAGSITGPATVHGRLRPNPTGLRRGTLAFGSSLDLGAINPESGTVTTLTRFDFGGTSAHRVVGVSVAGSLTYGGALQIAIPGTVFNGTYALFSPASAPAGAFASLQVLGAADAVVATLADNGAGVFTGSNGAVAYAFSPASGALSITGAATPAGVPAAPVLTATVGDGQVALSWTATGATYDVYRSTTAGSGHVLIANDVATSGHLDTGRTNGTTYYYYVVAENDAGSSAASSEISATPTAAPVNALQAWREGHFPGSTATTGPGADLADGDGDGRANLLEYAFGSNPTVANAGPGYSVVLVGGQLHLTYTRIDDPTLTYTVEGREDLTIGEWTTITPVAGNNPQTGFTGLQPGVLETETVTVIDPVVAGPSVPRRFLRLKVSY